MFSLFRLSFFWKWLSINVDFIILGLSCLENRWKFLLKYIRSVSETSCWYEEFDWYSILIYDLDFSLWKQITEGQEKRILGCKSMKERSHMSKASTFRSKSLNFSLTCKLEIAGTQQITSVQNLWIIFLHYAIFLQNLCRLVLYDSIAILVCGSSNYHPCWDFFLSCSKPDYQMAYIVYTIYVWDFE